MSSVLSVLGRAATNRPMGVGGVWPCLTVWLKFRLDRETACIGKVERPERHATPAMLHTCQQVKKKTRQQFRVQGDKHQTNEAHIKSHTHTHTYIYIYMRTSSGPTAKGINTPQPAHLEVTFLELLPFGLSPTPRAQMATAAQPAVPSVQNSV